MFSSLFPLSNLILCTNTLKLIGCFISYLECQNKTLGLRDNDGLPYYYFEATSYRSEIANKHINKDIASDGATWCPEKSREKDSFLEVDLGKQYLLCGVSTQGDTNINSFTTSYQIKLSSNRIHWKFYGNGKVMVFFFLSYVYYAFFRIKARK